eukprot:3227183-Amphidinium_carterae.2
MIGAEAIMREHAVRYWDSSPSRIHVRMVLASSTTTLQGMQGLAHMFTCAMRWIYRTALVDTTYCFNVHSGPHNENLVKYFNEKKAGTCFLPGGTVQSVV